MALINNRLGLQRRIVPLGRWLSRLQASVLQYVPGMPFTPDNYLSLSVPSTCETPFPEVFGIKPANLEAILPSYLK